MALGYARDLDMLVGVWTFILKEVPSILLRGNLNPIEIGK